MKSSPAATFSSAFPWSASRIAFSLLKSVRPLQGKKSAQRMPRAGKGVIRGLPGRRQPMTRKDKSARHVSPAFRPLLPYINGRGGLFHCPPAEDAGKALSLAPTFEAAGCEGQRDGRRRAEEEDRATAGERKERTASTASFWPSGRQSRTRAPWSWPAARRPGRPHPRSGSCRSR